MLKIEKREPEPHVGIGRSDGWNNFRREGYNNAIDELDKFVMDQEALAKVLLLGHTDKKSVIVATAMAKVIIDKANQWIRKES